MTGMTGTTRCRRALRSTVRLVHATALSLAVTGGLVGCGALDVSDPTAIEESELSDAAGAQLLRGSALKALYEVADDGALYSGLLADEFLSDPPAWADPTTWDESVLDRRESLRYEELAFDPGGYGGWQALRRAATVALPALQAYAPAPAHVGEMYALRGYAALRLAEDFCSGFPLHDVVDLEAVFSPPLSTDEALAKALADFDSALTYASDSARILDFARIGRARTLLALGRVEDAGAAVDGVLTGYVASTEYSTSADQFSLANRLFFADWDLTRSVADQEGGNGLDFVSAGDPRVRVDTLGMGNDGVTGIYRSAKYPNENVPLVLASGIEARLIEAEAALKSGGDWLGILNTLRATQSTPALPPLADPGTDVARQDLLFRERAFWLFATGHRLADLRRLVRVYGRDAEEVFPSGSYRLGGVYGTATSLPFPAVDETPYNPAVTGCISR